MTIERLNTNQRMSQAVKHGGVVYLAGQVADDEGADVTTQTKQVLAKIEALLAQVGSDKTKLLSANIWLADMGTFGEMNAVWDAWVPAGCAPARATVGAPLATPGFKVEIGIIAAY